MYTGLGTLDPLHKRVCCIERGYAELRLYLILRSSSKTRKRFSKKSQKRIYGHSEFIGNSSGVGTNAGVHAHVCASEKGKPVVRRGRKAKGPPSWEVAGLSNRAAGQRSG